MYLTSLFPLISVPDLRVGPHPLERGIKVLLRARPEGEEHEASQVGIGLYLRTPE
jgi:hypothetical protein|uniref:Uncharacterized protein n=1 Tax=Picea glauca TaxID=3330 RepID=A0A101LW62_PICGL|nr:hypothetical protein ABT39_MTgene1567 [Picea glauca]